jgi:hypothetical protein
VCAFIEDDGYVLDARELLGERRRERLAFVCRDPPGAPVGDDGVRVVGGEVGAGAHVARRDLHVEPGGFEDAAADFVLDGVVAEEREVARAAAGRDAG